MRPALFSNPGNLAQDRSSERFAAANRSLDARRGPAHKTLMKGIFRGMKQLALVAMILRALMPMGWMPGASLDAPFAICTMSGPLQHAPDNGKVPADHHVICPFAAAPHLAAAPELPQLAMPAIHAQAAEADRTYAVILAARFTPGSPRAPPLSA
jgi:hypothetical protein